MASEPARTGATPELIERAADSLELESGSDRTWCYFRALDMMESIFPPGAVLLDPEAVAALRDVLKDWKISGRRGYEDRQRSWDVIRAALEGPR